MNIQILSAVLIPFLGTCIGSLRTFYTSTKALNPPLDIYLE